MSPFPVEVVRSTRRRKTVSAEVRQGVLVVRIPARMSRSDERMWIERMQHRLQTAPAGTGDEDLMQRAETLASRFGLPAPRSIRWATQTTRWGSSTPLDRSVRVNRQLQSEPDWVLDYVIVHEIAHLEIPDHSPEFWELVGRYPLAERARGFLLARESRPSA